MKKSMRDSMLTALSIAGIALGMGACKGGPEVREDEPTPARRRVEAPLEYPNAGEGVSPEEITQIDLFFAQKRSRLQFDCYDPEVSRSHRKFEGNISFSLVVLPEGKSADVRLVKSTLHSMDEAKEPGQPVVDCVLENLKSWNWPQVSGPASYSGAISFKPAW